MQEMHLFEYAVLRIVPRVEREEFINVGVVLYCKKHGYLGMKYTLNHNKLLALCSDMDVEQLLLYLQGFENVCQAQTTASTIAQLDTASRFRWLTANRSTVLQTSKVHPGFCANPELKLQQLFRDLVE